MVKEPFTDTTLLELGNQHKLYYLSIHYDYETAWLYQPIGNLYKVSHELH